MNLGDGDLNLGLRILFECLDVSCGLCLTKMCVSVLTSFFVVAGTNNYDPAPSQRLFAGERRYVRYHRCERMTSLLTLTTRLHPVLMQARRTGTKRTRGSERLSR
jgi:hypothetical protein